MEHLTAFLTRMPKVELHVHLESTMPGEMLARFAARQGRELPRPAERLYDCSAEDLSDFLAFLDNICSFVGTPGSWRRRRSTLRWRVDGSISCTAR